MPALSLQPFAIAYHVHVNLNPRSPSLEQSEKVRRVQAVGAALELVDRVVEASESGKGTPTGFGICRPPGHHALPTAPMGFCLFSSIAIAARYAQQRHHLSRVMIFDFDVHHGNGTNDIFVDDPSVLFVSTHQSGAYPGTGHITEVGTGIGQGATLNIPLPGEVNTGPPLNPNLNTGWPVVLIVLVALLWPPVQWTLCFRAVHMHVQA